MKHSTMFAWAFVMIIYVMVGIGFSTSICAAQQRECGISGIYATVVAWPVAAGVLLGEGMTDAR